MGKSRKNRPKIRHMCSIGTLIGYGGSKGEWSIDQKLRRIRKAGFDGFLGRIPMITRDHVDKSGLILAATTDMAADDDVKARLSAIQEAGARCVNVQMLDHDTPTDVAVTLARKVMAEADALGLDVAIEVHRDTCTETPEKTYALAEGYEAAEGKPLKMTWDFSHPAVVKHLPPPYWDRLAVRPDLIQLSQQFHFRPFNGHHAQIPAIDRKGRVTPEFRDWLVFADRVIGCWMETATAGREMFACPEQIPGGYTLSVFPDRWKDVKAIRKELDRLFKKHAKRWKPAPDANA